MRKDEPYRKDWMSDDQYECACLFADVVGGFHHIYGKLKAWGEGIQSNVLGTWASFDFDQLTRILVLGHDSTSLKHPTIEDAIKSIRENYPNSQ